VQPFLADPRFKYKQSTTKGLSKARNIGVSEAIGRVVAFTDDDCRIAEGWIEAIWGAYETHPDVASVFGRILPGEFSSSSDYAATMNLVQVKRLQQVLPSAKRDEPNHQLYKDDCYDLSFGHGANMSFRRSAFSQYGEFDEFLGAGAVLGAWEDRDIGYRILCGGGQILYSPDAVVYHDHWREWAEIKTAFKNYGIGTGTAVNKYMRSGDWGSGHLMVGWFIQLGIRQMLSGIFKWHSWQKTYIGFFQLIYPWIGFFRGFKYGVDSEKKIYTRKKTNRITTHQSTDELIKSRNLL
jgi:glycosyltransferase involved in cell wall biosynthesis